MMLVHANMVELPKSCLRLQWEFGQVIIYTSLVRIYAGSSESAAGTEVNNVDDCL